MKIFSISIIEDGIGSINKYMFTSSVNDEEIKRFADTFVSIMTGKNTHGFESNCIFKDYLQVSEYIKNTLDYKGIDPVIPEMNLSYYY